jgi:two-component system nitrogen regulation sensor histidine kinase NtrY
MLAIVPDEVRGAPWRTALERRDLQPVRDLLKQLQIQPERRIERQVKLAAGPRTLTAWVTAMALTDEEGVSRGFILFLEDVSYLLRVERMEAWREVARRIAHEIKNPLTPIQLSAQRLRKRFADELGPEQQAILEECTTTIVGQVDQLKRLVNEFATFARLPAAEIAPKDLGVLADEALVLFREAHPGIDFALTLEPDVPLVEVDEEAIKRAIINLLDNAVAACQAAERPQVVVSVEHHPAMGVVQLQVSDNGPGMTPDVKARVFEPYFSTKKDGTGLGLAIVSAIVSEHQGYVRLFDNEPRGTRVVVEFPTRRRTALRAAIQ